MDLMVFECFCEELEKRAISPALMMRYLAGRAAQGVGGAAALRRQVADAAAKGATTSQQVMGQLGGLGKFRLQGVQEGGLAARRTAQQFGPAQANLAARIQAAEGPGMYDTTKTLRIHEGYMGAIHPYSQQYVSAFFEGGPTIVDPKGLLAAAPKPVVPAAGGTVPRGPRAMRARGATPQGQITGVEPTLVDRNFTTPGSPVALRERAARMARKSVPLAMADTVVAPVLR